MKAVKVAIVGASGYAGEDLVRLLLSHPQADLAAVTSRQYAGPNDRPGLSEFSHYPKAKTLRSPNRTENCSPGMQKLFFWPCRMGSRRSMPFRCFSSVPGHRSERRFSIKGRCVYKEFYAHDTLRLSYCRNRSMACRDLSRTNQKADL